MKKWLQASVLVLLLTASGTLLLKRQALFDWWHLRGYAAPSAVVQLATDGAMTDQARHLFYVNRPAVTIGKAFTDYCPANGEKTVVLGCYITPDRGIYVYAVTDQRLDGVEQVTAAHEMLHAAYARLSSKERKQVDAWLMDYYQHGLTDQRIKDTIEAYKVSEPNDVVNEMHSIFGTEVANLPAPLENYYRRYFTDRTKVTAMTARYQGEFTTRRQQVANYDAQLAGLKEEIDSSEAQLKEQRTSLDSQRAALQSMQAPKQVATYNAAVASYNRAVSTYNTRLEEYKSDINQYNDIVAKRNAVALEEAQLTRAITAAPATQ